MKTKLLSSIIFTACALMAYTANASWQEGKGYKVAFSQTRSNEMNLNFTLDDKVGISQITLGGTTYSKLDFVGGVFTTKNGYAELPIIHASVQLPADKNVSLQVENGNYTDYNLTYPLLPSRGTIYRNQDPSKISYKISPASIVDQWYPVDIATAVDPYIIRDVRGTNVYVYPIQYNAAKNILRVYNTVNVKLIENNTAPINPLTNISKTIVTEMSDLYQSVFINYDKKRTNWADEVGEQGEILVIYTSRDQAAIQPFISWKRQMGYKVTEQTVATGTNAKSTISTAYNANTKIFYVLLVGDWADIKSDLGGGASAPMDPMLGCLLGSDNYPDICVGRFSAGSTADVTTISNKTIGYEKSPQIGGTWYKASVTIGGSDGPGDDGELDNAQVMNIYTKKLNPFTYTSNTNCNASSSASTVSTAVNAGCGIINYCGHGANTQWVTTGFSNSNVSSLTNGEKLPFILSVACVNGEFHTTTCFAEAWQRKSGGGSVAMIGATINQSWNPPMIGQDYMNDLIVGGHTYSGSEKGTNTDHGKTHFGSIVINGDALMYSEDNASLDIMQTWTMFADPALQIRTDSPKALVISNSSVPAGAYTTNISVGGKPFANALVSVWAGGTNQPFSALTDAAGNVTISHTLTQGSSATLTVTGFNLATFISTVTIGSTAVQDINISNALQVYPSLNNGRFNIDYSLVNDQNSTIKVVDLMGKVIYSDIFEMNNQHKIINLNNVENGVYFLQFENKSGTATRKIIVQK